MDAILQGIPGVICYIDDIVVTGESEKVRGAATIEGTWHEVASGQVLFPSGACGVPGSLHRCTGDAYVFQEGAGHSAGMIPTKCSGIALCWV